MKTKNTLKLGLFLISALFIGSSQAYKESTYESSASAKLHEKERLSKQANVKLAEDVKDAFVNEKLFGKDKFIDMGLRVTARKGVVTISGRVESKENITDAVNIAKTVEGVKSVNSKMVVKLIKQPELTDDLLAEHVKDKFVTNKLFGKDNFEEMGIQVAALNGKITLTGNVGSDADAQRIISLTKAVNGVKNVESKMIILKN